MIKPIVQDDNLNKNKQRWLHRKLNSMSGGSVNVVDTLPEPSAEIEDQLYVLMNGDTATLNVVVKEGDDYVWKEISSNDAGINSVIVTVDSTSGNPQGTATFENGVLTLAFTGIKGEQGNTGSSVDYPFELVNNVTEGGADKALSAEQGKLLKELIDTLPTREELNNKANKDGYYGGMTVGSAENLVGRGSVEAEYQGIRTSAGSEDIGVGAAMIREMRGKSVVWNQLVQNVSGSISGYSAEMVGNKVRITNVSASTPTTANVGLISGLASKIVIGHKYAIISDYADTNVRTYFMASGTQDGVKPFNSIYTAANTSDNVYIRINSTISLDVLPVGGYIEFYLFIIDLTLMFGSTVADALTVEDCERMFPLPYYGYNPGTIINNSATGIKTVGFNLFNPATGKAVLPGKYSDYPYEYEICGAFESISFEDYAGNVSTPELYNGRFFNVPSPGVLTVVGGNATDTLVHLVWSGWRNYGEPDYAFEAYWENILQLNLKSITGKLNGEGESVQVYPEGMRGAGSAYDYLIVDADGYARRAVKVFENEDLGTLNYTLLSSGGNVFYAAGIDVYLRNRTNMICPKYIAVIADTSTSGMAEKTMKINQSNGRFYVKDSSYETAAAFKAAMSGVPLVFERATPLIYVLDEPIYLGYQVDDFGTEAKLPVDTAELPTGPVRYTVTYPFNAVDPLRRLPMNYISKESAQNLLNAMKSAGIIADFTMTYNATTQEYNFTITAPSVTPQSTNNETE